MEHIVHLLIIQAVNKKLIEHDLNPQKILIQILIHQLKILHIIQTLYKFILFKTKMQQINLKFFTLKMLGLI
jgi:2C-methyl-D-erythritol 2,4-cyclodiphosphate synthase